MNNILIMKRQQPTLLSEIPWSEDLRNVDSENALHSKEVSQMRAPLAARPKPAGNQNKATKYAICFLT